MSERTDSDQDFVAELVRVAAEHPDRTAIVDGERELTYGELIGLVNSRATVMAGAGLRPGDRVALVAENSADYLATAFAVWRADAVLATIYPSSGVADLAYCLSSSDPALVLADSHTVSTVREAAPVGLPVALIDQDFAVDHVHTGTAPNPAGLREPLSLICFTSGTTSRPKAIMLSPTALFNGARTYADMWHLTAADRTIVALPMAWLYGLDTTSMATLLAGGTVISLRRARPVLLTDAIERHHATFLPGVTTMFTKLVEHMATLDERPDTSSLRLCVSGGEPRNEQAFARWTAFTGLPVHDNFCASECFPFITYDPVADPQPRPGAAGRLVPRSAMRVVDASGAEVPTGEVGEALSRGPGLMLGYWGDPEQTRAVFTEDGWYRTKDLVRVDEDGYVYVVGRLSDLIIRGGSNISPAEVERVLRDHPAVRDASVVGLPDPVYGQRVVAAVVAADPHSFDHDAVAAFCASRLTSYKVPSDYVLVPELPQNTTTGKVDRRRVASALREAGAPSS